MAIHSGPTTKTQVVTQRGKEGFINMSAYHFLSYKLLMLYMSWLVFKPFRKLGNSLKIKTSVKIPMKCLDTVSRAAWNVPQFARAEFQKECSLSLLWRTLDPHYPHRITKRQVTIYLTIYRGVLPSMTPMCLHISLLWAILLPVAILVFIHFHCYFFHRFSAHIVSYGFPRFEG